MDTKTYSGNLGEAKALEYFIKLGYDVFVSFGGKAEFDLVIYCKETKIISRVSVKTTSNKLKSGKFEVQLREVRSNKNKNNIRYFNKDSSDLVFIYVIPDDRCVVLLSKDINNTSSISV